MVKANYEAIPHNLGQLAEFTRDVAMAAREVEAKADATYEATPKCDERRRQAAGEVLDAARKTHAAYVDLARETQQAHLLAAPAYNCHQDYRFRRGLAEILSESARAKGGD